VILGLSKTLSFQGSRFTTEAKNIYGVFGLFRKFLNFFEETSSFEVAEPKENAQKNVHFVTHRKTIC
jgi:hypothetical protein